MRKPYRASLLPAVLAITASCGGGDGSPTLPTTTPAVSDGSGKAYLDRVLDLMQANSINRLTIDWGNFRLSVHAAAPNAATIADTYPAIRVALGLLGDQHSFFRRADGIVISNPSSRGACADVRPPVPQLPERIGYVRIAAFSSTNPSETLPFAQSIQQQIRSADSVNVVGWIVDLRGNGGGNMWPMLAGVGPVLGEGDAGQFVTPTGVITVWGYANGSSYSAGSRVVAVPDPYRVLRLDPKVAVLTDCYVASSGEAIAIAFRGRPNARSFGTATYGVSTANSGFSLPDGGQLVLTVAVMADRTGFRYGDVLVPDEVFRDPAQTVQRAVEWLSAGSVVAFDTPRAPLLHSSYLLARGRAAR